MLFWATLEAGNTFLPYKNEIIWNRLNELNSQTAASRKTLDYSSRASQTQRFPELTGEKKMLAQRTHSLSIFLAEDELGTWPQQGPKLKIGSWKRICFHLQTKVIKLIILAFSFAVVAHRDCFAGQLPDRDQEGRNGSEKLSTFIFANNNGKKAAFRLSTKQIHCFPIGSVGSRLDEGNPLSVSAKKSRDGWERG